MVVSVCARAGISSETGLVKVRVIVTCVAVLLPGGLHAVALVTAGGVLATWTCTLLLPMTPKFAAAVCANVDGVVQAVPLIATHRAV